MKRARSRARASGGPVAAAAAQDAARSRVRSGVLRASEYAPARPRSEQTRGHPEVLAAAAQNRALGNRGLSTDNRARPQTARHAGPAA